MEKIYYKLRDLLANLPQGFPSTEHGVELEILKKLFTPEQAKIFICVFESKKYTGFVDSSSKRLQKKLEMTESVLAQKLDEMSKQGLLFRQRVKKNIHKPTYAIAPFIVGLYEFSVKKMDKELAQLCNEYKKFIARWQNSIKTKPLRVVPVNNALSNTKNIMPYNKIYELIDGHRLIAVSECICSKERMLLGHHCKAPLERCISFDWYAQHYIDTGLGRQITKKELDDLLLMANEVGLVIGASNTYPLIGFCLCCNCCCTAFEIINNDPVPAPHTSPYYHAEIDSQKCTQCGLCVSRCNMDAIKLDHLGHVDLDRCIGCGLCITTCPTGSIQLIEKEITYEKPPKMPIELALRMTEEHIKNGNLKRILLLKLKFAKTMIRLNRYMNKIKKNGRHSRGD